MFLADKSTGFRFSIDTGAEISVIPPRTIQERNCTASKLKLFAANGTTISTFGEKLLTLDLNLRREFRWPFIIASVSHPIIQMSSSSSDRGSKLRGPSQNSPRVASKRDVNITKLN
ncbi:hypothetical protein AVEN_263495-1 [Araneus ventricosus]|uniref:Peptidase A2 domain-containing protein n=1 Tax=Araneus ventricosus TaxID=182803 RepID=A0A4Y2EVW8_ARAVE|nr:hypothetical protein AVEN_263495-1 [Araneus ventricosus]